MQRTPVESSQIVSIGYDAGARKLEVEKYPYKKLPAQPHKS